MNDKQLTKNNGQQSIDTFKTIFENIDAGIAIIDEDFKILFINKYLSNIGDPSIKVGDGCFQNLNGSGKQCVGCPINNKKTLIETCSIDVIGANSNKFMIKIQPIELDNRKALLELWIDLTGRGAPDNQIYDLAFQLEKRVNEQIELIESQRKAMVQSDKLASLGKLVAGVAHEINNPVVFIRSNIEILQKYWEIFQPEIFDKIDKLPDKKFGSLSLSQMVKDVPEIMGSMYRGTDRIKSIVFNLKGFARKDAEAFGKKKVSIEKVVSDSLNLVHSQIKNKMKVVNDVNKDLPLIPGSHQRLEQVFVNLFINAFDANAPQLTVSSKKELNNVVIDVHDNGSGIPEDKVAKIFDPFFTTKGFEGTGMGLSISFGIIKEHKGTIEVSAERGKGTTFTIKLPYEEKTILIVDDDIIILDIVKKVLEACGYLVKSAHNGKEAVALLDKVEPCLVLTDMHMPEMDGFELIKWIRSNEKHEKLPILVMTGVEKEIKKVSSLSISDYIAKPFSTKILANTIREILKEK